MSPSRLKLEIEKTDEGYNIINGNGLDNENYSVRNRHELSVILHIFLNLLDDDNIDYTSKLYSPIID